MRPDQALLARVRFLVAATVRDTMNAAGLRPRGAYASMGELARRYGLPPEDLTQYELKVFSQNGEDGVLQAILDRVGAPTQTFVEFGIGDGTEGNCVFLAAVLGWRGVFLEGDDHSFAQLAGRFGPSRRVTPVHAYLQPDSLEETLLLAGAPLEPDVLSIDVDGNDYYMWDALAQIRPRVVVIEYNGAFDPHERRVQPYCPSGPDGSDRFGASLAALCELATAKGYRLVHTELAGVNAFFVRADLAGEHFLPEAQVALRPANYYLDNVTMHLSRPDA